MPRRRLSAVVVVLLATTAPAGLAQTLATNATERFTRLDVNHDGGLSRYEMDAEVILRALDKDGDNKVSPAELRPLLGGNASDATTLDRVRIADRDMDDRLDANELDRATLMRFNWIDGNQDGVVDQQELLLRFGVHMVSGP